MFPEHQQSIIGVRKRRRRIVNDEKPSMNLNSNQKLGNKTHEKLLKNNTVNTKTDCHAEKIQRGRKPRKMKHRVLIEPEQSIQPIEEERTIDYGKINKKKINERGVERVKKSYKLKKSSSTSSSVENRSCVIPQVGRGRRRKINTDQRSPEVMAARRKRVWQLMSKKELARYHRVKLNNHKEVTQNCKRVATMCMKVVRQRAMQSQKVMKETVWRAKRLTREMVAYWKRYERVERDTRRRLEKEAEEQRKMDFELLEAKRQQRKLNFLITQTELYAHFMSRKLGKGSEADQLRILNQLDEEVNPRLAAYDDYDAESLKKLAKKNASEAFKSERSKANIFDMDPAEEEEEPEQEQDVNTVDNNPLQSILPENKDDLPQPTIFQGKLKTYQIKGKT